MRPRSFSLLFPLSLSLVLSVFAIVSTAHAAEKPHIIFVMADDMGWGQTSYRGHPILKTPHLDAMAANGLRFDRFYAGGPVCSPTRAAVLTGRSPDRTGVLQHGYALRLQEKTIAQALKGAGYVTGHFGKWHLNGHRGPGAPILAGDPYHPGKFGFDAWVSVSNFYDINPLMSRAGKIEEFQGDSSAIAVAEAVKFLEKHRAGGRPMFAVIWDGSPHSPFKAAAADLAAFDGLDGNSANHHGELVAMDRSIGTLRAKIRELGLAENTLLVFCSDNGGLPAIKPSTVGHLRGFKGSIFEGGLRVPGIIEWPGVIKPRVTDTPASVMDLFPTVADIVGLPADSLIQPIDGQSLRPLFARETGPRNRPIGFRYGKKRAFIDDRYKLSTENLDGGKFELFDLIADPTESRDVAAENPMVAQRLREQFLVWNAGMDASFAGKDYPEGRLVPADPTPIAWNRVPAYQPYLATWKDRWEYANFLKPDAKSATAKEEP
jgi:arylsulfatase A-like enzyme